MNIKQRNIQKLTDPLGETLYQIRLNGSLYCNSELTAPWGITMPKLDGKMMFHIITAGKCWLQVGKNKPHLLHQGTIVLVPQGKGHVISSDVCAKPEDLFNIPVDKVSERYEVMRYGGGGELTELTCGVVSFDHVSGQQLILHLPEQLIIGSWDADTNSWLQSMLRFITNEAKELKIGGETIITHLSDILIIQVIRAWVDSAPEAHEGWFAALRHQQIGKVLVTIHRNFEKTWTVESLAREVGMSRSAFSAKFTDLVGDSVKSYLTNWRMQIARNRLMNNMFPISIIAEQMGYNTEAAFSRAFKRNLGITPGSVRHRKKGVQRPQ